MEEKNMKTIFRFLIVLVPSTLAMHISSFAQWNQNHFDPDLQLNKSLLENLWAKTYGDSTYEEVRCVKRTYDGGYIVAGLQNNEVWVLKLNPSGEIEWQKLYKNAQKESYDVYDLAIVNDGGYIVVGSALTCYEESANCLIYGWLIKLNSNGEIVWQKAYKDNGGYGSVFYSGHETTDGGCIVAGWGNILGEVTPHGKLWTVKLDSTGVVEWERMFNNDSIADSYARSIQQTKDGGYVVAGVGFRDFKSYKLVRPLAHEVR